MAGKAALGIGKAWFHISKGMAEDALGITFGTDRRVGSINARDEYEKAYDAVKEMKDEV